MINHFVAFDFETANGKDACSIGIVEYVNGKVAKEYYTLIKPKHLIFNPITSKIHGITIEDVINEREFVEIWKEIKYFFDGKTIVAHNSSFDLSVLNNLFSIYHIEKPIFSVLCTYKLSRNYLNIDNYKLSTVADFFNIKQDNYHNALEDANVCGKVFIKLSQFADNGNEIRDISGTKSKSKKQKRSFVWKRKETVFRDEIFEKEVLTIKSIKLEGFKFVISGLFTSFYRNELKQSIEDNGGRVMTSISSKTDYLIAGDKMGPAKRTKAESLGVPIISEDDFLAMIL